MALTSVGIYEFNAKDLIGHGAFAVVYKGRLKTVSDFNCHRKYRKQWKSSELGKFYPKFITLRYL